MLEADKPGELRNWIYYEDMSELFPGLKPILLCLHKSTVKINTAQNRLGFISQEGNKDHYKNPFILKLRVCQLN